MSFQENSVFQEIGFLGNSGFKASYSQENLFSENLIDDF